MSLFCQFVGPLGMLQSLPRVLMSGLVVAFFVMRRGSTVSMGGEIVKFSSLFVRIFHGYPRYIYYSGAMSNPQIPIEPNYGGVVAHRFTLA